MTVALVLFFELPTAANGTFASEQGRLGSSALAHVAPAIMSGEPSPGGYGALNAIDSQDGLGSSVLELNRPGGTPARKLAKATPTNKPSPKPATPTLVRASSTPTKPPPPTATRTATRMPPTATRTATASRVPPTATRSATPSPLPVTATRTPTRTPTKTATPLAPTATIAPTSAGSGRVYYVATTGNDTTGNGTITNPWRTIANGVSVLNPGDTLYIRGGDYPVPQYGLQFQHSGVNGSPITLTNYPNEAVTLRITVNDGRDAFYCGYAYGYSAKVDYIRIIGTNVPNRMLSNGVASTKGIVVQGLASGPTGSGISVANCNNWEVAGLDFVDVDSAIWLLKVNNSTGFKSTTGWNIHDNRVHGFYAEVGIQSNGDYNTIANNEVFKVKSSTVTPWGCDHINVNGHHNVVRGNTISPLGGQPSCIGILLEWDLADHNIIEGNRVYNTHAVTIAGGDNNVIRNNIIHNALPVPQDWAGSIIIDSYDNRTSWPCDDAAAAIMPPNNPANPDYPYYYNPRNCHSWGNQIYNNTLANVFIGIRWDGLVPEQTVIRNNAIYNWVKGSVCSFNSATGGCDALPTSLTADHNLGQGDLGFVNPANFDFHLTPGSPLIDAGYSLGVLVPDDFDGELRPRGAGFDIGAHEF